MKKLSVWTLVLAVLVGAAVVLKTKTVTNMSQASISDARSTSVAFRDGMYLGKLTAQKGEPQHVAVARWAFEADRESFTEGYAHGYSANLLTDDVAKAQSTNGAFRDGLYLGELDAKQGNGQHIASGRWSTGQDRASFVDGYSRAYDAVSLARLDNNNWK
jgi:hypothetical protein